MRVTVEPASDGYNMRGNWVTKRGGTSKPSTKKSAAVRKARRLASEGDTLVVKGTDGRIQSGYPRTYRGDYDTASQADSDDEKTTPGSRGSRDRVVARDDRDGRESRDWEDDSADDSMGRGFRDPYEGEFTRDDFDENQDDVDDELDDLF